MANDARYMPLYVAQYLADTPHLNAVAHGAYMLLIMNYWQRGKPLPDNDRKLSVIARCTSEEWADIRDDLAEYFTVENGLWSHEKIEKEIEKAARKIAAARKAGRASGASRNETESNGSNGRSTVVQHPSNHKVRLGKEDTNVSFSARGGARGKNSHSKIRRSSDAAFSYIDRINHDDDEAREDQYGQDAAIPVQCVPAIGSG